MQTKTLRKKMKLDTLKVESMVMPAAAPIRAVTTSATCPTRCDTEAECSNVYCDESLQFDCSMYCETYYCNTLRCSVPC